MANIQAPFGFQPYSGNGSAPTYEQVTSLIANADTNPLFRGDPVFWKSTGYVGYVAPGTATLAGIFMGCKYLNTSLGRTVWLNYWPGSGATGDILAYIINDPNAQFLVQAGGSTSPIVQADIFANVAYGVANGANSGSTLTGISGAYVDQTTIAGGATTTTEPFRIQRLITNPPGSNGTDITTGYNYVVVSFNAVNTRVLAGI